MWHQLSEKWERRRYAKACRCINPRITSTEISSANYPYTCDGPLREIVIEITTSIVAGCFAKVEEMLRTMHDGPE